MNSATRASKALKADAGIEGVCLHIDVLRQPQRHSHGHSAAEAVANMSVLAVGPDAEQRRRPRPRILVPRRGPEGATQEVEVIQQISGRPCPPVRNHNMALPKQLSTVHELLGCIYSHHSICELWQQPESLTAKLHSLWQLRVVHDFGEPSIHLEIFWHSLVDSGRCSPLAPAHTRADHHVKEGHSSEAEVSRSQDVQWTGAKAQPAREGCSAKQLHHVETVVLQVREGGSDPGLAGKQGVDGLCPSSQGLLNSAGTPGNPGGENQTHHGAGATQVGALDWARCAHPGEGRPQGDQQFRGAASGGEKAAPKAVCGGGEIGAA
mmetsp:Transcript_21500/g.59756  ORF Transcript_21500/g.59756 Transcript_21500/m.59756 type:complete len:322 (+) Transcript_21500:328-1293(+)